MCGSPLQESVIFYGLFNLCFSRFQPNMFYLIYQKKYCKTYLPIYTKGSVLDNVHQRVDIWFFFSSNIYKNLQSIWWKRDCFLHSFVFAAIVTHMIQLSGIILLIEFIAMANMWVWMGIKHLKSTFTRYLEFLHDWQLITTPRKFPYM